ELLLEAFRELLRDHAPDDVVRAARRPWNHDAHGLHRIVLREPGGHGQGRERGASENSDGQLRHEFPPSSVCIAAAICSPRPEGEFPTRWMIDERRGAGDAVCECELRNSRSRVTRLAAGRSAPGPLLARGRRARRSAAGGLAHRLSLALGWFALGSPA